MRSFDVSHENKSFVPPPPASEYGMSHGEGAIDLSGIRQGDVVRFELEDDHTWFYCSVAEVLETDEIVCTVVDTQSWPNLALAGFLPGRPFRMPLERVLSVVR
jgi:hypothetical protein